MFQRLSKEENAFLSFWILSINDIGGERILGSWPFFRTLCSILGLWPWNRPLEILLSSLRLWATVSACVHVQAVMVGNHTFLSGVFTVTSLLYMPQKKFWVERPIRPAIKNWAEEFSDILLSSEKGLREVSHKGGGSDPRDLRSFSVMCP